MWWLFAALLAQTIDYQAEGLKALDAQKYDVAAELLQKAVAADPQDYAARFNLGLAYSFLGRHSDAIPQYKAVLELRPGLYEAELNLGISLLRTKDAAAAASHLKAAAEQRPKEYRPAFYFAEALLAANRLPDAEAAYITAIALKPDSAAAELGLALTLEREKRLAEAEPHLRKAAALDSKYKDSLLELAEIYGKDQKPAEAIAIYKEFPGNPAASERMGALLLESGQAAEAIPALEAAVNRAPTSANRIALAQAYDKAKQPEKALETAAKAAAADSGNYEIRMFVGRLALSQRKLAAAASQFDAATKLKPDSVEAWNELASAYIVAQDYPQALAALDRVRTLHAETSAHFYFRAISLDHLHQLKEALANYNRFLEMSQGKSPEEEFKARQRVRIIERELSNK